MKYYVYDIEVYQNLFMAIFINLDSTYNSIIEEYIKADVECANSDEALFRKMEILHQLDYKIFIVNEHINESGALANWIANKTLIGYNNHNYDDKILRLFLYYRAQLCDYSNADINKMVYSLSNSIINESAYYSDNPVIETVSKWGGFYSIDLMRTHYLDKKKISLKNVAVKLNWYKIEDLPYRPNLLIDSDMLNTIKDYCINDVLITRDLWYKKIEDIKLRYTINEDYEVDVLSNSRSSIADKLLYKYYCASAGYTDKTNYTNRTFVAFENLIDPNISFKTPHMKEFLNNLKLKVHNRYEKFSDEVKINNTLYQLGVGGLHSVDTAGEFHSTDEYLLEDCDVTSYYPQIIINRLVYPAHLNASIFIPIIQNLIFERVECKVKSKDKSLSQIEHDKYKLKQFVLKIVINSIFGKLGTDKLWTCDHAAMYNVTLNGQLYLLELAEEYELNGITVVSANTDGLLCKIPKDLYSKYEEISNNWCKKHRFNLEFATYKDYYRRNVNSYLAIIVDNEIKVKNDFVYDLENDPDHLIKGFDSKIIPYALVEYYVNNTPVRDTVMNCKDIYWFCKSQKVGDQFNTMFYYVDKNTGLICTKKLQKTNRYYVSKTGGSIIKQDSKNRKINVLKGQNITLLNMYFNVDKFEDYNINYAYYINECNKIINELKGLTRKTIGKTGLTLFD